MREDIFTTPPPFDIAKDKVLALANAQLTDPFTLLGPYSGGVAGQLVAFVPGADAVVALCDAEVPLMQVTDGLWAGRIAPDAPYRLRAARGGEEWAFEDPYRFGPVLGEMDEHLFSEGTHKRLWHILGARVMAHQGVEGTAFAVWAPGARAVSVVGAFNFWDGRRHPMRPRGTTGIWELFIPELGEGTPYKYQITGADGTLQPLKADPLGFGSEHPPANASVIRDIRGYGWKDGDWMESRATRNDRRAPISIYEVHLGSWKRKDGRRLSSVEAAEDLVDYVADMGFTHIELMPVSEYPFDGSWGYQPVGLYAPTVRHGPPHEFRDLIDAAHRRGIGVVLDWVPGHFPADAHGLARFDGTHLYEHADPREGYHPDWNTLIYNYGRREVANFLTSNALYWLEEYHVDGLRVDAVASMLYRDYSRKEGEWVPNVHGGRENLEAIAFLRAANRLAYGESPGIMTVAEESTAFPGVSAPAHAGGLGFGFKWNMGWMNDTLRYMAEDPVNRKYHHHLLTFGIHYAFSENFILPISHDEVVHGKGSMLARMPGDNWQKFANLRAYYGFMWGHPGKKLLFMGCEFGQRAEWNHDSELPWDEAAQPANAGLQRLVRDLNALYRDTPALHARDCEPEGFGWLDGGATELSVIAFSRHAPDAPAVAVICNFTPMPRRWRCPLPAPGRWREALNTDAPEYGGTGVGNGGAVMAAEAPSMGQPASAEIELPPLATLFLIHDPESG